LTEGEDTVHAAGARSYQGFAVSIVNERGEPQPRVRVTFQLPETGATGVFPGGGRTESALTDAQGKAAVWGIHWGDQAGVCTITILARLGDASAGTALTVRIAPAGAKRPQEPEQRAVSFEVPVPAAKPSEPPPSPVAPESIETNPEPASSQRRPGVILTGGVNRMERLPGSSRKWLWISLAAGGLAGGLLYMKRQPSAAPPAAVAAGPRLILGPPSITIGRP